MDKRIIFHIDVNSAFLSWEAAYQKMMNPNSVDLRTIPSAVGGDRESRRGIILAKSIPAKKYNIQTGEPIVTALQKCPNLILVKPNYNLYEQSSKAFMEILYRYSDMVEKYSIDEAFIDMSASCHLYGAPVETANTIKNMIKEELGFTVNIGISANKLLAKMASDFKKPDSIHTLFPDEIKSKIWPLSVRDLFFVGRATEKKLCNLGIKTIGELANADVRILKSYLKKYGEVIYAFANGIDSSAVIVESPANKGYGNSTTTPQDVTDKETARLFLLSLSETVCTRLRSDNVYGSVVSVELRDYNFRQYSHQSKLKTPTNITKEVAGTAFDLFEQSWDGVPLRHLGVRVTSITKDTNRQINLFDMNSYEKEIKLDNLIDQIRCRFGNDSIKRGCFLDSNINSLAGGIPKEYRR